MPFGRKRPSRVPPGETATWMSCSSAAAAKGAPLKPLSPSRSPSKPSPASRGSVGRMPARSSVLAGWSSRSSSEPCLSLATKSLMPLTSLPPSKPRAQALGEEAERAAVDYHRRGQDLVAAGKAPVEGQALAQPAPQPEPGPAGEARVQRREGNAREQPGDAPLHAPEGQHPDQPDHAPPQGKIRLAPAAMHPNPLAVHGLQLRLDREDEHLHIGQGIPAVTAAGPGNRPDGRRRQISGAQEAGVRHRPQMVRRGQRTDLYVGTDIMNRVISRTDS